MNTFNEPLTDEKEDRLRFYPLKYPKVMEYVRISRTFSRRCI